MIKAIQITPADLDKQSPIKIDKWLDIDSEECKEKDPDRALSKKWMKICMEDGFLFTDSLGRVWGRGETGVCFPYHFNVGKRLYGFRVSAKAAN